MDYQKILEERKQIERLNYNTKQQIRRANKAIDELYRKIEIEQWAIAQWNETINTRQLQYNELGAMLQKMETIKQ